MSNTLNSGPTSSSLGRCLLLLVMLLWVGSCVFDRPSKDEEEQAARAEAGKHFMEAQRLADIARYRDDPLLVESARKSPSDDAIGYTISVLGGRCQQVVSVMPLKTPMLYDVICPDGSAGLIAPYRV